MTSEGEGPAETDDMPLQPDDGQQSEDSGKGVVWPTTIFNLAGEWKVHFVDSNVLLSLSQWPVSGAVCSRGSSCGIWCGCLSCS